MKRALITAAVGGLLSFLVPQAASAESARPVAPYDHSADHGAADCAGQPEGSHECPGKPEGADEPEQAPPPRNGDKEQEHSDGGEILF